jgi:hypothetical protein
VNKQDQLRFDTLDKRIKELERDKEADNQHWQINQLDFTIASELWWEGLQPHQIECVARALKSANKIWFDKVGISVQFVEHKYE